MAENPRPWCEMHKTWHPRNDFPTFRPALWCKHAINVCKEGILHHIEDNLEYCDLTLNHRGDRDAVIEVEPHKQLRCLSVLYCPDRACGEMMHTLDIARNIKQSNWEVFKRYLTITKTSRIAPDAAILSRAGCPIRNCLCGVDREPWPFRLGTDVSAIRGPELPKCNHGYCWRCFPPQKARQQSNLYRKLGKRRAGEGPLS